MCGRRGGRARRRARSRQATRRPTCKMFVTARSGLPTSVTRTSHPPFSVNSVGNVRRRSISACASAAFGTSTLNGSATLLSLSCPALVRPGPSARPRRHPVRRHAGGSGLALGPMRRTLSLRRRRRLHRHAARRQPARRLHRRARRSTDGRCRRSRARRTSRRRSSCCPPTVDDADVADPHLHADVRAAVRRASDARLGVRARRGRCSSIGAPARDRRGVVPVLLEREGARISFGWMDAADADVAAVRARRRAARGARRRARSCRSRCTTSACSTSRRARLARRGRGSPPDFEALAELGDGGIDTASRRADGGWKTRMFVPARGVPEDPATGSAAGPLARPPRPPRPDRVGRGDRDHAGRRDRAAVAALRARGRDAPSASRESRSAAARSWSRAASSASRGSPECVCGFRRRSSESPKIIVP